MKNKLGIISGLFLSLVIATSAFAGTESSFLKTTNGSVTAKTMSVKNLKPKKHRKHRKAKKVAAKLTTPSK